MTTLSKILVLSTDALLILFFVSLIIPRSISFIFFTEDTAEPQKQVILFIDGKEMYQGQVGYDMFGYKSFNMQLTGGFHHITIRGNKKELSQLFFVFMNETITLVIWEKEKNLHLDITHYFRTFMFS